MLRYQLEASVERDFFNLRKWGSQILIPSNLFRIHSIQDAFDGVVSLFVLNKFVETESLLRWRQLYGNIVLTEYRARGSESFQVCFIDELTPSFSCSGNFHFFYVLSIQSFLISRDELCLPL
jgi:hypothetical protein